MLYHPSNALLPKNLQIWFELHTRGACLCKLLVTYPILSDYAATIFCNDNFQEVDNKRIDHYFSVTSIRLYNVIIFSGINLKTTVHSMFSHIYLVNLYTNFIFGMFLFATEIAKTVVKH